MGWAECLDLLLTLLGGGKGGRGAGVIKGFRRKQRAGIWTSTSTNSSLGLWGTHESEHMVWIMLGFRIFNHKFKIIYFKGASPYVKKTLRILVRIQIHLTHLDFSGWKVGTPYFSLWLFYNAFFPPPLSPVVQYLSNPYLLTFTLPTLLSWKIISLSIFRSSLWLSFESQRGREGSHSRHLVFRLC